MSPLLRSAMKKLLVVLILVALIVMPVVAQGSKETAKSGTTNVYPDGDILIKGKSLFNHMTTHTHIDSKGGNTTPPQ